MSAADAFTVTKSEYDSFFYIVNTVTGEVLPRAYPLRKSANRAARVMSERAAYAGSDIEQHDAEMGQLLADEAGEPATSSPLLNDGTVTFSDDEPTQIDVEDIAPTVQPDYPEREESAPQTVQTPEIIPSGMIANVPTVETREAWLMAASVMIGSILAQRADLELPPYRVTCGWPSTKATAKSKRRIGECWNPDASADAHAEIFISPLCAEPLEVVAILARELIHAALPKGTAHKAPFVKAAKAIGFAKPFTQITTTPELVEWTQEIVDALPAYPHAALSLQSEGAKKPQVNRQLLAKCEQDFDGEACGYQCRLARKWIVEVGAPICPRCQVAMVCEGLETVAEEVPEGEGED